MNRNSPTPYAAAVSRSRRKPSRLRSRELRQAMLRPPMASTSWATATLDTVARPMWLSGMRNEWATLLIVPIWWRTCFRSGLVGGSISQTSSKDMSGSLAPGRQGLYAREYEVDAEGVVEVLAQ